MTLTPLAVRPIGVVRSPFREKAEAPRQGAAPGAGAATLVLEPEYLHAVEDLDGFERVWLLFWFDRAEGWSPKVHPPRSSKRRGVFATRSPHRPNPIGLTAARLLRREGCTLFLDEVDLLDGTPVLDVKPYVPYADAFPAARAGWLEEEGLAPAVEGTRPKDPVERWEVAFSEEAARALAWLEARGVGLRGELERVLALGPRPHPARRIRVEAGGLRIAVKEWRARLSVEGRTVRVERVMSGYRAKELVEGGKQGLEVHREFSRVFPGR